MPPKGSAHQLFTGPFPALERRFFAEIVSRKRLDPLAPVDVLVGSNLLALSLRRRYASENGAVANLRFLTFLDLARERVAADDRASLPALGAVRLAALALGSSPLATAFGRLRDRPSLARALVRTADDLRDAGVPPSLLPKTLPSLSGADRKPFLAALGESLFRFEEMRRAFADSTSLLERAAAQNAARSSSASASASASLSGLPLFDALASSNAAPKTAPHSPLLVFGIYDLGAVRDALLRTLASERSIIAFVPTAEDGTESLFTKLLGVSPVRLSPSGSAVEPASKPPMRQFVLAADDGSEAREVVREVLRAVDEGTPLHRIAILLRSPASQEAAISGELTRLTIPFFRPVGTTLAQRPIGRAALLAVELAASDFRRETLLEFFDLIDSLDLLFAVGLGGSSAASLVHTIETLGYGEGRERWPAMVARAESALRAERSPAGNGEGTGDGPLPDEGDEAESIAAARRERRLARLVRFREAIELLTVTIPVDRPASWKIWAARFTQAFETLFGRHDEHALLVDALLEISELESVEPGASITVSAVLEAFTESLERSPTSAGRFERDGVTLLSVVAARGLRFDTVIIPGLVEKSFPAASRPDPLLSDDERNALSAAARVTLLARSGARHAAEERFLFTLATQCAERRLVLTAARRDATRDRTRLLSPYLLEAMEAIHGKSLSLGDLSNDATLATIGVRRTKLGRAPDDQDGPPLDEEELLRRALDRAPSERALIEVASPPLGRAFRRSRARALPAFTEYEGLLGRAVPFLSAEHPISATRLERLAGCAYRSFLGDVLRLRGREEAESPLYVDNLNLGILIHAALTEAARLLVLRGASFAELPAAEADLMATRLAARHLDDWAAKTGIETYPIFLELSRKEFAAILQAIFEYERKRSAPLPLAGAEVRFGPPRAGAKRSEEDPNLSFDEAPTRSVGEHVVSFTGMIDRVDRAPGRVHVIDYKISGPQPYAKENRRRYLIAGGERSQLAIYALAAQRLGAGEVSSEFLFVERPKAGWEPDVIAHIFDPVQTRVAMDGLDHLLAGVVHVSEHGTFFPSTTSLRSARPCARCDFASICGAGHVRVIERKWDGDAAARGPGATISEMRKIP